MVKAHKYLCLRYTMDKKHKCINLSLLITNQSLFISRCRPGELFKYNSNFTRDRNQHINERPVCLWDQKVEHQQHACIITSMK